MKDDAPAFLTITSLQLPDSPIPLIDSQAIARASCPSRESSTCNSNDDKDAIMDELLRKVVAARGQSEGQRSKRNKEPTSKCNREFNDLEECTRRIIEGPGYHHRKKTSKSTKKLSNENEAQDCICSEVSENLRINIRKKTEVRRSSRSPSPEVTHIIRIAMKYHGQQDHRSNDGEMSEVELSKAGEKSSTSADAAATMIGNEKKESIDQTGEKERCNGVNVALDFTLNCSSLQLTSRDICVRQNKIVRESLTRSVEEAGV